MSDGYVQWMYLYTLDEQLEQPLYHGRQFLGNLGVNETRRGVLRRHLT